MAKREQIVTPKGKFIFPKLHEADYKFKEQGEYSVKLRLSGSEAENFRKDLQSRLDDWTARWKKENRKKPKIQDISAVEVLDDDGNETGEIDFKFAMPANVRTKAGKEFALQPKLFDAKGKPIPEGTPIWGGSIGKVAFWVKEYEAPIGIGISCKLEAAQVIELVGPQSQSAGDFGFGEEEGYEAPDEAPAPPEESEPEPEPEAEEEEDVDF